MAWTSTDADQHALASAKDIAPYESPYPSPGVYVPYEAPKKKHDAIAEAWGIHEPEPFEDFSAGGGHSTRPSGEYNTASSRNGTHGTRRTTKDGRDPRDVYREYLDDSQPAQPRRQATKRSPLPPPQPIFVGEPEEDLGPVSPTVGPSSPGNPKRTKSIMRRIRKMRDNPNIPVGHDEDGHALERDPSPPSSTENSAATHASAPARVYSRPTHRPQNSFLGRFGRGANTPRGDTGANALDDAYVYVEDPVLPNKNKSLPATPPIKTGGSPPEEDAGGYFDAPSSPRDGLGRKTSLLKKVKGVVKNAK